MTARTNPIDELIQVLNDAISSKLVTVAALETATKEIASDIDALRLKRARLLASDAGVQEGGVFLIAVADGSIPVVVWRIKLNWKAKPSDDWSVVVAFRRRSSYGDEIETNEITSTAWAHRCRGAVTVADANYEQEFRVMAKQLDDKESAKAKSV